ncbi:MAG: hypothetical protein HQM12_09635 [SAR324 cluster bacterium]|nr:hypothetical protein [SAR324 cluster bacterium]
MSSLLNFFDNVFSLQGAQTEFVEPEGLDILIPENLQTTIKIPEMIRLGFGETIPQGAQKVSLESDWFEKIEQLLADNGGLSRKIWNPPLPSMSDPERMLEHTLSLSNATYRYQSTKATWSRYWFLNFHYTARSDETREGLLWLGFNLGTGSVLDQALDPLLTQINELPALTSGMSVPEQELPQQWSISRLQTILKRSIPERIQQDLGKFLSVIQRHMDNDLNRITQYHQDMRAESIGKLLQLTQKKELSDKQEKEKQRHELRLEAVLREYQSKVSDLYQKYALDIECTPVQILEVLMPVQRCFVNILRRKGHRMIALDWNPLIKKLEIPPCEYTFTRESSRMACDDQLHLIHPDAHKPCPSCEKPFCRACFPVQCPKCQKKL